MKRVNILPHHRQTDLFCVSIPDEVNSSTNFDEMVILNAANYSFDLDVDPTADQAITFSWFCKRSDEVCFYFLSTVVSQRILWF